MTTSGQEPTTPQEHRAELVLLLGRIFRPYPELLNSGAIERIAFAADEYAAASIEACARPGTRYLVVPANRVI